ncbi:MAG: hypothetical protein JO025_04135 [Verrucomicrobia bacterium]|nr:hypothetical protein [Verrucomicrobiota bacterium]
MALPFYRGTTSSVKRRTQRLEDDMGIARLLDEQQPDKYEYPKLDTRRAGE